MNLRRWLASVVLVAACERVSDGQRQPEPALGDAKLTEEYEVEIDGRWWEVYSFTDQEAGLWCYVSKYRYADDYRSGIACFPLTSLPVAPAKGQIEVHFINERARVMRVDNEALGIVCMSHLGDLDCHRSAEVPREGARGQGAATEKKTESKSAARVP